MPARVVIQHRSSACRDALAAQLAAEPGVLLAGAAADAAELVRLSTCERPDAVVIEADAADWDVGGLVVELRARLPALRVIGLHDPGCPPDRARAERAGIALVPDTGDPAPVAAALRAPARRPAALTERELEVLRLISAGRTTVEISATLGISRRTIENHKRRIFLKLGVQSQAHAVASAARQGLLSEALRNQGMPRHPAHAAGLRLVLGRAGPVREQLARVLGRHAPRPVEPPPAGGPPEDLVAVLVDPEPEDWQAAADLGARVVLVLSGELDQTGVVQALLRGADAVLPAAQAAQQVVTAVELVGDGHTLIDPVQARALVDAARTQLATRLAATLELTAREREILASIDRGDSVKQTARALGISSKTVENLQGRLFRKLGVRNRAQAVGAAHGRGLLRQHEPGTRG